MSYGKVFRYSQGTSSISGRLYDFSIGKADIKPLHENWMLANVVPILNAGGSLTVIGLTSRTDTDERNMILSKDRAEAVVRYLRVKTRTKFKVAIEAWMGEKAAKLAGVRDGVENENWRAVVVHAWKFPDPPPPPPPPPPKRIVMVERRVLARWIYRTQMLDRGATSMDGDGAKLGDAANNISQDRNQKAGGYRLDEEQKKQVPDTHKLILIDKHEDPSSGSRDYVTSGVKMDVCTVHYTWAKSYPSTGPIMIDRPYSGKDSAFSSHPPAVWRLTEAQADLWLKDPPKARLEQVSWKLPLIPYKDYQSGKY